MQRRFFLVVAFVGAFNAGSPAWAARSNLISETAALQHGLTRPWFSQVALDQGRGRLSNLVLFEGVLYATTNKSVVHAFDAETGQTLWSKQIGQADYPTMSPGVNRNFLAVVNGSRLFVLNRLTGEILLEREIKGAPGAGPALSAKRAYVPTTTGMLLAYRLQKPKKPAGEQDATKDEAPQSDASQPLRLDQHATQPMFCQAKGKALVQPLVTRENSKEEYVVWPTDIGALHLARVDRSAEDYLTLKYRLETGGPIVGRPAYVPPDPKLVGDSGLIICASRNGFVYVYREKDGQALWSFSVGEPIVITPAVVDDRVYVTAQLGGMYCLAVKDGRKELWSAPGPLQFVAASKSRVYASDRLGRLLVLDANTGARLGVMATGSATIPLLNTVTDRIYLGDEGGLIQCLHEVEQREPLVYSKAAPAEEEPLDKPSAAAKAAERAKAKGDAAKERPAPKGTEKKAAKKTEDEQ